MPTQTAFSAADDHTPPASAAAPSPNEPAMFSSWNSSPSPAIRRVETSR